MTTHLEAAVLNTERDNDYFTATIVGLPSEIALGKVFTKRKLSQHPTISIDAITAAVWHSDAAHALLKQRIKQTPKTMGLPYPAGNFARRRFEKSCFLAFLLGFSLCAVLFYAYATHSWLQQLVVF
jgi:TATA-binding protein-associated factor Taf7